MTIDVAKLVKEAGEAAKLVPEHLQEAAFNKVFDALMAASGGPAGTKQKLRGAATPATHGGPSKDTSTSVSIDQLNRTAHPEIDHNQSGLDNALRLLRAAKQDLGIDGLTATEIARVLTDKFRCRIARRSVARILDGAGRYVDRHKEGQTVVFRIMGPGEDYLDAPHAEPAAPRPSRKATANKATREPKKKEKPKENDKKRKSSASRPGPGAAMTMLLDAGFFSSPRTIGAITAKLQHDRGRSYAANELSPQLLRWLRSGKLTRAHNAEGQYEYSEP